MVRVIHWVHNPLLRSRYIGSLGGKPKAAQHVLKIESIWCIANGS